ncbi:hypothetical protein [Hyphomicrobium sp.]|uniref:hypothetical protein n=1 Tax=Hyphomicrobium sp. TaxID=82 RepID=UPI0025C1333C|nr:hypothetical protein [Hyphomicrobium sp.]MCC7253756.1 hypothetical protein [Hyphomicrobium sp.]
MFAAVGGVAMMVGAQAALAFTYENQGTSQPSAEAAPAAKVAPSMGFGGMDPKSVLPPIGESISDKGFDFGPGAFNNGLASQPTRGGSVGPSWLYPPGN